mgnify:CR=1 FL=1
MMATFSYKKNHMQTKSDKKDIATILQEKKEDFSDSSSSCQSWTSHLCQIYWFYH